MSEEQLHDFIIKKCDPELDPYTLEKKTIQPY